MQQNQLPPVQMYPMQNQGYSDKSSQQQQFMGIQVKNGLQKLADSQGIFIKQKFEALEALTGYETPNVYKVYPADINGSKIGDKTIFKCKEKSSCCARQCLPGDCRPLKMQVSNLQGQIKQGELEKTLFLELDRPFKCTCCCLARPEMQVNLIENGQKRFFGKVTNPCWLFSLGCNVEDSIASCCTIGNLCMGCPCKSCQELTFEVKNSMGEVVTRIQKQSAGCFKACVGDSDNFAVGFPPGSSPEDKALLMTAALFIDYMYFENKQEDTSST